MLVEKTSYKKKKMVRKGLTFGCIGMFWGFVAFIFTFHPYVVEFQKSSSVLAKIILWTLFLPATLATGGFSIINHKPDIAITQTEEWFFLSFTFFPVFIAFMVGIWIMSMIIGTVMGIIIGLLLSNIKARICANKIRQC